jgi:3-oxoacyl-[acyl-carrier-protein] synthase II
MTRLCDVYIQEARVLCSSGTSLLPQKLKDCVVEPSHLCDVPVYKIPETCESKIAAIQQRREFRALDRVTLLALAVAETLSPTTLTGPGAVVVGSSRGATGVLEREISSFYHSGGATMSPVVSPTTTAGNIASYLAFAMEKTLLPLSLSMTCTSALASFGVALSLVKSGLVEYVIAGASEAPLTPFTIAQMKALRIYSQRTDKYACQPFAFDNSDNTFALGEGAGLFALSSVLSQNTLARIAGYGFGRETLESPTGMTLEGLCLENAMRMALGTHNQSVDVVITHAPGTKLGDAAEKNALNHIFGKDNVPFIASTKWFTGHTFGASGALGVHLACELLHGASPFDFPYKTVLGPQLPPKGVKRVLINTAGFGGVAHSLLIEGVCLQ